MTLFKIHQSYELAKERYAEIGVDTENVITQMEDFHLSFNTWQLSNPCTTKGCHHQWSKELQKDFIWAKKLIPGRHRLNLHAMPDQKNDNIVNLPPITDLNDWMDWSRSKLVDIDLMVILQDKTARHTLTCTDPKSRQQWVDYLSHCRETANTLGENQKSICVMNLAVMDTLSEPTLQRMLYRKLLEESLDLALAKPFIWMRDCLESLDFSPNTTLIGSQEQISNYAIRRQKMYTLTTGHAFPTFSTTTDSISTLMNTVPGLLIHLSRPSRWSGVSQSLMNVNEISLFLEIINSGIQQRVHYSMDYYTPHIPRAKAYVIKARAAQCCMMRALLKPVQKIHYYEFNEQHYQKLALLEETKTMPWGAVFNEYCLRNDVPVSIELFE